MVCTGDRDKHYPQNAPFSALVCGVQGSGKSHTVSVILENMFMPSCPNIGSVVKPLCGLVLHFGEGGPYAQPCEAAWISRPAAGSAVETPPVRVFVSKSSLKTMQEVYAQLGGAVTVEPLLFNQEELDAHARNQTWTVAKLPPGCKAIGSRWVFKIKRKADGSVERYKARIVAKGFSQRPGFDFFETFAPTAKFAAIRAVLAIAAIEDLHLRSLDISHAFINGDLDADVYMEQPEGFEQGGPDYVCHLKKSIYGLKQAARLWYQKLQKVLEQMGFKKIYSDNSLYVMVRDRMRMIMPVFVDDITLASNSVEALDSFVKELS